MTDTTTTATDIEMSVFGVTDNRHIAVGEIARLEQARDMARERIVQLEAEVRLLRTEQITDGADSRLVEFWDRAGRIADAADFCTEYDRIAEAMNGTPRERDYSVTMDVTITLRVTTSATGRGEAEAAERAQENLSRTEVIDTLSVNGWDDIEITDWEAEQD